MALDPEVNDIIRQLFLDDNDEPPADFGHYNKYIELYNRETRTLEAGCVPTVLLAAIEKMKTTPATTRQAVFDHLTTEHGNITAPNLQDTIDCAVRIWLMIDSRTNRPDGAISDSGTPQRWKEEQRLCDFVYGLFYGGKKAPEGIIKIKEQREAHFSKDILSQYAQESADIQNRLTHKLTAVNLSRYPKIGIHFTSYLHDHLEFQDNYKDLIVFEHKCWLKDAVALLEKWESEQAAIVQLPLAPALAKDLPPFPIPLEVLKDALMSLDYLFPPGERATNTFLRSKHKDFDKIRRQAGPKPRLKEFRFYHDHLITVSQEFLNPPRNWRTIWSDNRNPVQFWTFWLGLIILLLTFAFGLVASVLAGLQYNIARHPPAPGS